MIINSNALLAKMPIKDMLHRKVSGPFASHGLAEAGYDIRLKQQVWFSNKSTNVHNVCDVEMSLTGFPIESNGKSGPGHFALASAIEEFDMPSDLVGIVHDKSTWARKGLSVFNTVIEPGWKGFLTLELVYHGQGELLIPAGTGIAQVLFHSLALEREYRGKYQNQEDKPVPAKGGTLCSVCHEPQFDSPGGVTCANGHGGAEPL